jgi:hypothetical protein
LEWITEIAWHVYMCMCVSVPVFAISCWSWPTSQASEGWGLNAGSCLILLDLQRFSFLKTGMIIPKLTGLVWASVT